MPSPNQIFTEIVTTTLREHRRQVEDAVSHHNALIRRLFLKRNKKTVDGGFSIVTPLQYAMNQTYQRYSGFDILNIGASDVLTAAEYPWRQIAINVVASGRELRINNGKNAIISLAREKMRNAIITFKNLFSFDVYSDGTLPNQVNGLQALISDTGMGTIGGINASDWAFWRNKVQSAAAPLGGGAAVPLDEANLERLMLGLWIEMTRGSDQCDLIVSSNDLYQIFENSQLSIKRYTQASEAQGGFISLKYKSADVFHDGGSGIPNQRMYFMNTDYLDLTVHRDADISVQERRVPVNQDAEVIPTLWMGNLTCSNRMLQGVLKP